jgi:tape measure domain-containing protein
MPTISELNIAIGADITGLRRDLRTAERALRDTGANLANIGRNLTQAVTVPLVGIGAMSLKVAGEMESLRLAIYSTFEGAGRSMQEANVFLEQLRESAKAPGLDFPQAVQGAIRLMNTGMAAEKAKYTIEQLANAIAASGGTADDLNEVVNQFSQMIGKGKILNEDLKILTSRMPKLSQAMNEVFGTTNADKIRDMGVTAQEFVDKVTAKMAEFPRVQGGISNAFVNLTSSVKQFAAQIGDDLNKSLNLQSRVEAFSGWLEDLAASFRALSPETKEFIAKAALAAAALGPVTYAVSMLIKAGQTWAVVAGAVKIATLEVGKAFTGLGVWIMEARKAFLALSLATQIGILGALTAAVGVAVYAWQSFNREITTAEKVQKSLTDVQTKAEQGIVGERLAAERLVGVLKDENAKRVDKVRALNELKAIAPDYFGKLDIERSKTADLTAALDSYIANLMKAAKVKAAMARIEEIEKQLLSEKEMAEAASVSIGTTLVNALLSGRDAAGFAARQAGDFRQNLQSLTAELDAEKSALEEVVKQNTDFTQITNRATVAVKGRTEMTEKQIKAAEKAAKAEKEWANEVALHNALGQFKDFDLAKSIKAQTDEAARSTKYLNDQLREMGALIQAEPLPMGTDMNRAGTIEQPGTPGLVQPIEGDMPELDKIFENWKSGIASFGETFAATMQLVSESGTASQQAFMAVGASMQQYAEQGGASLKELANTALGAAAKVIRAQIMQGVTAAAMKALTSVPFPFNIAAATAAGAIAGTLFNGLISKIGVPKLAKGGLAYAPTMAIVGDNPGASSNPEVIAPLDKLQRIMGGGSQPYIATIKADYDGLYLNLERTRQRRERSRGY